MAVADPRRTSIRSVALAVAGLATTLIGLAFVINATVPVEWLIVLAGIGVSTAGLVGLGRASC
jgi:hypothetical protein